MNTIVSVTISSTDPVTIKDERKEIAQGILDGKISIQVLRDRFQDNRGNLTALQQSRLSALIDRLEIILAKKDMK